MNYNGGSTVRKWSIFQTGTNTKAGFGQSFDQVLGFNLEGRRILGNHMGSNSLSVPDLTDGARPRKRCGYVHGIKVDSDGIRGGLCLAWKAEVDSLLGRGVIYRRQIYPKDLIRALQMRNGWPCFSEKLDLLKHGLTKWAIRIQAKRKQRKSILTDRLTEFLTDERDDSNMAELINTRVQLNLEIDNDERY
ncbi:hypothetical protein PVK06_042979 [Gossypium arboreum]|uniref:Reverse transcriptase n=1 Tax=Gossypium arboreum TaxID=29729 RepID=A0ABR0MM88_GOSAR|nr:hypothetical protein PVK06_042979 [Gossypium arboreum]